MKKLFCVALSLICLPVLLLAYSTGPPPGTTGAPGESTCIQCHFGPPVNTGSGNVRVVGLPVVYQPGVTYSLTVFLENIGQSRWGFELVIKDTLLRKQAGVIILTDPVRTKVINGFPDTALKYLEHTIGGTYQGISDGPVMWSFQWRAPDTGVGAVGIYLAGNASNNNLSTFCTGNSCDTIYTAAYIVPQQTTTVSREIDQGTTPSQYFLHQNYPNPFNPRTNIRFEVPGASAGTVNLTIFNLIGQKLKTLVSEPLPAGSYLVNWDGTDEQGYNLSSGIYFYRLSTELFVDTKRLVLIR